MNQQDATRTVTELFEGWGPFLVRYAVRMTRSFDLAEDLVQEVFLAVYRDLRAGKHVENPKAWTLGAVRNQVRKHARYIQRHAEDLEPPEVLDLLPSYPHWPDLDAHVEQGMPPGLDLLSAREEEVLLLRLQSLKYREIADRLGIGSKSVCTLLARALKKLQIAAADGSAPRKKKTSCEVPDALQ